MTSNTTRIQAVFSDLEQRGIIARYDFWDCNSCASSAMLNNEVPKYRANGAEHQPIGYVFFHEQDTDSANRGGMLYLAHGSISEATGSDDDQQVHHDQQLVARMVVGEFREHGFEVEWSGATFEKIGVLEPVGGWNLAIDRGDEDDEDEDYY